MSYKKKGADKFLRLTTKDFLNACLDTAFLLTYPH
jgi:hypothetical protein